MNAYREDLAYIHHIGHGALARAAAPTLASELSRVGLATGTIVDLGCGSGILARHLTDAGYAIVGFDVSDAMVAIARTHVPNAEFHVESFVTARIPSCVGVAAIGEVLNYGFDDGNDPSARRQLFARVYKALAPNGVLLFDMAGFGRLSPGAPRQSFREGEDWAVLVETALDETTKVLTRQITSFRQVGQMYRRATETHRLQLVDPAEVLESLRSVGFHAEMLGQYGGDLLPPGLVGFLARKS